MIPELRELLDAKYRAQRLYQEPTVRLICVMGVDFHRDLARGLGPWDYIHVFGTDSALPKTALGSDLVMAYPNQVRCIFVPKQE